MSEKKRTLMTSTQKAKVALEAVKGSKTVNEIAQEYSVHPTQVGLWKRLYWKMPVYCLTKAWHQGH